MSKMKVNRIENTATTDGGINIDTSGHVQVDGLQMPTAGALSSRNLIINGDMRVAQRSTSAVNNVTAGSNPDYKTLDRWGFWAHSNNLFTTQQVADAPSGFYNSIKVTSLASSGMSAGAYASVSQRIEAQNLYSSNIGTSTAKDFIVSFWVKGSISGTYTFYALNSDWQQSFVKEYTINVANTWEHKTLTIPGPTTGFSATGNARQLEIGFSLGAGTIWSTSVLDQWQTSSFKLNSSTASNLLETSGATLNFTGVQLEVGTRATPFEHESYGQTLAKCQRYYHRDPTNWYQSAIIDGNGTLIGIFIRHPVSMRATPSITHLVIGAYYWNINGTGNSSITPNGTTSYYTGNQMFGVTCLSGCTNLGGPNNDQITGQFKAQIEYSAEI